ncbi:MAG: hypothetical protein LBP35_00300 [Candidatus Ancillula trichonymphae]|jgi:hypothetical protein|nr:hypothetical protein [Candidatus Ancillula trichonymphae]
MWESASERYDKIAEQLVLNPEHLQSAIITDVKISNLDEIDQENINKIVKRMLSKHDTTTIERLFWYQIKDWILPHNVARSHSRMMRTIYEWFTSCNIESETRGQVHRIIICNEDNLIKISEAVDSAKRQYETDRWEDINTKRERVESPWKLPDKDEFGDSYELIGTNKYAFNKCFVRRERSQAERKFEQICEKILTLTGGIKMGNR